MLSDTQPTQLVHPEIQSGHSFTNVLLVDSIVKDFTVFVDSVNSSTFPIVYSSNSSKSELVALLQTHFAEIKRIGLCFVSQVGDATELFLDNEPFSFSENKDYLVNIINTFQVKNMDFLACDTLHSPVWNDYYTQLTQSTSVIIGASDDKTGNIKYGGDWIMESTSEDLESIYFNQNIGYYNYLLDITLTFLTFAALKGDGSVVAWGAYGGTAPSSVTSAGSNVVHIYSNQYAFAALKGDGSVVVWGDATSGGSLTSPVDVASQLGAGSNVIHIYSNNSAFAALKSDGTVVAWGNATDGGTAPSGVKSAGSNVVHIYSNITAFAALKGDGSVVAWGGSNGGNAPSTVTDAGSNVVHIYSNNFVFAALKSDGTVVAWGSASFGANAPSSVSNAGSNVVHIYSNGYAFADLKGDGSVVAWGYGLYGGSAPTSVTSAGSNVIHIYSNDFAFAALKGDGSVVAWGNSSEGGSLTSPVDVASQLGAGSNVVHIYSNYYAFAALKRDGSVVAWGGSNGGNAPSTVTDAGSNVIHIYSNKFAFAALKGDGSVVAWGDTSKGGNPPSSVTNAGSNVIHIYSNSNAFAALKSDGSVVVWGDGNFGGSLTSPVDVASQLGAGSNVIRIFPSSPYSRSDVNPLPVIGNTITVPTTGPALRLTSGLAVQNRAARKAFVRELITNNSIALATTGVKMVVDAAAFLNSSIRSTITKSKVNLVTSSTLSGGEFDTTTSLASDEALYAPLENIGDFIVIKLPSGNKIKFEKSSLTEYNVYEDSDNNMTPTATLLEGVVGTFENFNYVTGSVTGEIEPPFAVSGKLGWNLVGATKTGDVFDSSNIIITMVTYNTDSKSYVSVDLINGKRTVTEGNGYFVNYSQDGFVEILKNW